jgi:hypothetical protein
MEETGMGFDVCIGTGVGTGEGVVVGNGVNVGERICPAPQPDINKPVTKRRTIENFAVTALSMLYSGFNIQFIDQVIQFHGGKTTALT